MITRETGAAERFLELLVAEQLGHRERAHVDLVKPLLHRGVVDLVRRVLEMARVAGGPAEHLFVRDDADVPLRIDRIGADEELLRFAVDEAVRRGAADALRPDDLFQIGGDLVELVGRAARLMRRVGDHPQTVRPRHHRTGAAFLLLIEDGEVRVDAADLERPPGGSGGSDGADGPSPRDGHGNQPSQAKGETMDHRQERAGQAGHPERKRLHRCAAKINLWPSEFVHQRGPAQARAIGAVRRASVGQGKINGCRNETRSWAWVFRPVARATVGASGTGRAGRCRGRGASGQFPPAASGSRRW